MAPDERSPSQAIEYNLMSRGGWTASAESAIGLMTAIGDTQDEAKTALVAILNLAHSHARRLSHAG